MWDPLHAGEPPAERDGKQSRSIGADPIVRNEQGLYRPDGRRAVGTDDQGHMLGHQCFGRRIDEVVRLSWAPMDARSNQVYRVVQRGRLAGQVWLEGYSRSARAGSMI